MEVEAEDEQERPCSFSFTYLSFHRSKEAMQLEPRSRVSNQAGRGRLKSLQLADSSFWLCYALFGWVAAAAFVVAWWVVAHLILLTHCASSSYTTASDGLTEG